ncbi:MAG: hypothetical protein QXH20_03335 [Candidatus Bathyarchaeia archaeon]
MSEEMLSEVKKRIETLEKGEKDKYGLLVNRYDEGWLEVLRWFLERKPSLNDIEKASFIPLIPASWVEKGYVYVDDYDRGCLDALHWLMGLIKQNQTL